MVNGFFLREEASGVPDRECCEAAWKRTCLDSPYAARHCYFWFRTVIPELRLRAKELSWDIPRISRKWAGADADRLLAILDETIDDYERQNGTDWMEYLANLQEPIHKRVMEAAGSALESFNDRHAEKANIILLREAGDRMVTVLEEMVPACVQKLESVLQGKDAVAAIEETIQLSKRNWRRGHFWLAPIQWPGGLRLVPPPLGFVERASYRFTVKFWRDAENRLREEKGIPAIGEGWSSEAKLLHELRTAFPEFRIQAQATPMWLGQQRFDCYFPDHKVAVEYQGEQHQQPLTRFGGKVGFVATRARDKLKRQLCQENNCRLVLVYPEYALGDVIEELRGIFQQTEQVAPPSGLPLAAFPPTPKSKKSIPIAGARKPSRLAERLGSHDLRGAVRHGTEELILEIASGNKKFRHHQSGPTARLLLLAAQVPNFGTLRALLKLGWDVNREVGKMGGNALAVICNAWTLPHLEAVRMLLEAGSDVTSHGRGLSIESRCGYAPPMIGAALQASLPLAKLLVEYGASVKIRLKEGRASPFLAVCRHNRLGLPVKVPDRAEFARWLVVSGANPHVLLGGQHSALDSLLDDLNLRDIDSKMIRAYMPLMRFLTECNVGMNDNTLKLLRAGAEIDPCEELAELIEYGLHRQQTRK